MSEGKVAAQISHAVKNLGITPIDCDIIVLKVSDKKFEELISENECYVQIDKGLTEVESGTKTAMDSDRITKNINNFFIKPLNLIWWFYFLVIYLYIKI